MTEKQLLARWAKITDPRKALAELIKYSFLKGQNLKLHEALWKMAERVRDQPQKVSVIMGNDYPVAVASRAKENKAIEGARKRQLAFYKDQGATNPEEELTFYHVRVYQFEVDRP